MDTCIDGSASVRMWLCARAPARARTHARTRVLRARAGPADPSPGHSPGCSSLRSHQAARHSPGFYPSARSAEAPRGAREGCPLFWVHSALVQSLQSCPTFGDPMDCSAPGSPVLHCALQLVNHLQCPKDFAVYRAQSCSQNTAYKVIIDR